LTKSRIAHLAGAALLATGVSLSGPTSHAAAKSNTAWNELADQYFDTVYFPYQPTNGTLAGFHQYDAQLERYDRDSIAKQATALHTFEHRVSEFPKNGLGEWTAGDRQLVLNNIHSVLLTIETIKPWEKNPDYYSTGITGSAFSLMERKFAPPEDRLRSLIARERQMPAALSAARQNLHNCPKIYTEIALEQLPGDIEFFRNDVPSAFSEIKDEKLLAEFKQSNGAVIDALSSYEAWMKSDLLPRSNGDFRIGKDTFALKLLYDEMVNTPLDQLLQIGEADLHKNQAAFHTLAHEIDPHKTPQQVLMMLGENHPAPDQLLGSFRDTFSGLIQFIREKHIVTIPSDVRPTLEETPPFMRATTQASMDTPGPFETHSTTAYFNVTLPEKSWNAERTSNYMHAFNVGTVVSTSVHEAYPGTFARRDARMQLFSVSKSVLSMMVGVALVTFALIFTSSIKATLAEAVSQHLTGSAVVFDSGAQFPPFSDEALAVVAKDKDVSVASGISSAQGLYLATSPNSSFFYVLTVMHALHVLGGLAGFVYAIRRTLSPSLWRTATLDAAATYWHFGVGANYSLTESLDLSLSYVTYLAGTNTHFGRGITIGTTWNFNTLRPRSFAESGRIPRSSISAN